jgi:predicted RNA-binding Zn ribbon-like protein
LLTAVEKAWLQAGWWVRDGARSVVRAVSGHSSHQEVDAVLAHSALIIIAVQHEARQRISRNTVGLTWDVLQISQ